MLTLRLIATALIAIPVLIAQTVPSSAAGWHGRALCTKTGAIGEVFNRPNRASASGAAVAACVSNGGIPNCCRITKLDYHSK